MLRLRGLKSASSRQSIDQLSSERSKSSEWVDDLTTQALDYLRHDGINPEGLTKIPHLANVEITLYFERRYPKLSVGNLFSFAPSSSSGAAPRDVRLRDVTQVLPGFPKSSLRLKPDAERRLDSSKIDSKRVVTIVIGGNFPVGTGDTSRNSKGTAQMRWSLAAVSRRVVVLAFEDSNIASIVVTCLQMLCNLVPPKFTDLKTDGLKTEVYSSTDKKATDTIFSQTDGAEHSLAAVVSASKHVASAAPGRKPKRRQSPTDIGSTGNTRAAAAHAVRERRQNQAAMQREASRKRLESSNKDLSNAVNVERANYQTLLAQYMEQNNEHNDMCEANKTLAKELQNLKQQLISKDQMFKQDTKTKYKMSIKLENALNENAENNRQIRELVSFYPNSNPLINMPVLLNRIIYMFSFIYAPGVKTPGKR